MIFYYLPAVLVVFDVVDPGSSGGRSRRQMISDANFVKQINAKLQVDWAEPGLKAIVLLKWTIFLAEIRNRDASLEEKDGFKAEQLESNIWNAVQGDCFPYLTQMVVRLHTDRRILLPASLVYTVAVEHDSRVDIPSGDFVSTVLEVFEVAIRSLIIFASSELRKIKQRQEDLLIAGTRADRSKSWRSVSQSTARHSSVTDSANEYAKAARSDIASMFTFMGLLYSSLPPDYALSYWSATARTKAYVDHLESSARKLPSFLQWAVWSTQPQNLTMLIALFDMLTGLANGERCSELAYNFLVKGGGDGAGEPNAPQSLQSNVGPALSWYSMFGVLESWAATGSASRANPTTSAIPGVVPGSSTSDVWHGHHGLPHHQSHPSQSRLSLSQQDVLVAQSFLHLLSTVVTHSTAVRANICTHARFRAVPTLVSLIPLSIPLELKGTLFDTLSSFCQPGAGATGVGICKSIWALMERLEIISVRGGQVVPSAVSVKGVEVELEEVESAHKVYPATIAFVKLLSTLIHTPKSIPISESLSTDPLVTIPENFGHPYRTPGVSPYIHFVVDNVFANIPRREYLHPSDRWRMNDACLSFVEHCLASFDIEALSTHQGTGVTEIIHALAFHPGFEIMKRLLSNSVLQTNMLSYLAEGTSGFDKGLAEEQPFFRHTIVRALRIVVRVLEIEDLFLDVLIPMLSEATDDSSPTLDVHPSSYYVKLSQVLFFTPGYISAIAIYVTYSSYPEARLIFGYHRQPAYLE